MIVQTSHGDDRHMVLTMEQHTATGGVMAEHYGGIAGFDRLEPHELVTELVHEHDRGWIPVDAAPPRNPDTDLPWNVYDTPTAVSIGTGPRSIDHNEDRHPYRGLLASMHIIGLFTGRFGLNAEWRIDSLDGESRDLLEPMIAAERERQIRLRNQLETDPETASWLEDDVLMRNYRALQFFDGLALWLQVTHPIDRRATGFDHVPTIGTADVSVTVIPIGESRVELDPFPFDADPLEIVVEGRWLSPQPDGVDLADALAAAPVAQQVVELVGAR